MKFTADREEIINVLGPIVELAKRAQFDGYKDRLLLRKEEGVLVLTSTDLDTTVRHRVEVNGDSGEGDAILCASSLLDFCKAVHSPDITMDLQEANLVVKAGRTKAKLPIAPGASFPAVPAFKGKQSLFDGNVKDLSEKICSVGKAASKDVTRSNLCGVFVDVANSTIVATDGFRVFLDRDSPETPAKDSFFIPSSALQSFEKSAKDRGGMRVQIAVDKNHMQFKFDDGLEVLSRLSEGTFPNYRQIVPAASETPVFANAKELLQAAKVVMALTHDKTQAMRMTAKDGQIYFEVSDAEAGDIEDIVDAGVGKMVAYLSGRFMIEALTFLGDGDIRIAHDSQTTPIRIDTEDGLKTAIIMPMRDT